MVNVVELQKEIDNSRIPMEELAHEMGYKCKGTLYNKLKNPDTITVSDIEGFTRILKFTKPKRDFIFFAKDAR